MLLEKGIELFHQYGYHGTGLAAILEACKVSKGSFYNSFKNKEAFAISVIEFYHELEIDRWSRKFASEEGPHFFKLKNALIKMVEDLDFRKENVGCLIANLSGEVSDELPLLRKSILAANSRVKNIIAENILICQNEGSVRLDLPADTLSQLFLDCWRGALLRMKVESSLEPLFQVIDLFWSSILIPQISHDK